MKTRIGARPPDDAARLAAGAVAVGARVEVEQHCLCRASAWNMNEGRAVEQEELERGGTFDARR